MFLSHVDLIDKLLNYNIYRNADAYWWLSVGLLDDEKGGRSMNKKQ